MGEQNCQALAGTVQLTQGTSSCLGLHCAGPTDLQVGSSSGILFSTKAQERPFVFAPLNSSPIGLTRRIFNSAAENSGNPAVRLARQKKFLL